MYIHTIQYSYVRSPKEAPFSHRGTPERKLPDRVIYRLEADGGATHMMGHFDPRRSPLQEVVRRSLYSSKGEL